MKTKFLSLLFVLLISAAAANAQAKKNFDLPVLSQNAFVSFNSCFYLADSAKQVYTMKKTDFDALTTHDPICTEGLDKPSMPVFFTKTAKIESETVQVVNNQIQTVGKRQNVSVTFKGWSADVMFVDVKINDQPVREMEVRENEVAFVNAGLLDAKDKNSNAFLAFQVKLTKE